MAAKKENGVDQPRRPVTSRLTNDRDVTSTVLPVRSVRNEQFKSEPCLTDREAKQNLRLERIVIALSKSDDDVTTNSCEPVADRRRRDVIHGKAVKRITRLTEAQCDGGGFGASGPHDEGYQTKDSMSLEKTILSQLRSQLSLSSVAANQ